MIPCASPTDYPTLFTLRLALTLCDEEPVVRPASVTCLRAAWAGYAPAQAARIMRSLATTTYIVGAGRDATAWGDRMTACSLRGTRRLGDRR